MIKLIALRELRAHLSGLGFWLMLALAQVTVALLLFAQLEVYRQISPQLLAGQSSLGVNDLVIVPSLNSLGVLLLLLVPLLGMRAFAEERRSGHLAVLLSTPLPSTRLLLGKWLGNGLSGLLIVLTTVLIPISLAAGMQVDFARLAIGTLALTMLVFLACALTLAFSVFSRHAGTALAATLGCILLLWLLDSLLPPDSSAYWLALNPHLQNLLGGTVLLRDLGYFVLLSGAALGIAAVRLASDREPRVTQRWRLLSLLVLGIACLLAAGPLVERLQQRLLSAADRQIPQALEETLQALDGPVVITAYAADLPLLRARIAKTVQPLQLRYRDLELQYVDPQRQPQLARDLDIRENGEMVIEGMGRRQHVRRPDLQSLSLALGRIARHGEPWIVSLHGHGELQMNDRGGEGLSGLRGALEQQGYRIIELDPLTTAQLPENAAMVLVAAPRRSYPAHVVQLLDRYLHDDGRVLWLHEGTNNQALRQLSGVSTLPGRISEPLAARAALAPGQVPLSEFPASLLPQPPRQHAVLDGVVALSPAQSPDWQKTALLQTSADAWNETASLDVSPRRDPLLGEQQGPLNLALALQRAEARMLVIGDASFATNAGLGVGGNRTLALGLVNWLTGNRLATAKPADDIDITWNEQTGALIALLHLLVLPALFLGIGVLIRWQRERA